MKKLPYIRLWLFLAGALVSGQLSATLVLAAEVHIPRVSQPPRLEDFRDMNPHTGNGMLRIDNFTQRTPDDGAQSSQPTVVYLSYDQPKTSSLRDFLDAHDGAVLHPQGALERRRLLMYLLHHQRHTANLALKVRG